MPSHGSLTKAGKVRSATPKIQPKERRAPVPRIKKRTLYFKRFVYNSQVSQQQASAEA
ncbi:30S ribosomal protein S30e [Candidatus Marsarchaeota G2 archaeon ECH_B_SAG-G16]|jgi:small subunit ribosomal protein S30e|uniref:30S ribosomal protein S30e n=2 Tax=Candidatus Marsarchaeota TaxID=1978152 RepID=A0A2R6AD59_9ARCH|nr:MAG: 30S ribosomal protein S30e [Candidatus Marsarchaeota G1 archaeon OSP_D]PSO04451.1 MAG: 30S ribosomal protein S30e [Candidatus Marsarchaeota G2 archaeon ECH_B_SAG-G16]